MINILSNYINRHHSVDEEFIHYRIQFKIILLTVKALRDLAHIIGIIDRMHTKGTAAVDFTKR